MIMPNVAGPTGSGIVSEVDEAEDPCGVPPLDNCLQFFRFVGVKFMDVVDEALSRLEEISAGVQVLKSEKNKKYQFALNFLFLVVQKWRLILRMRIRL
jgi:hypothetical protein